MPIYAFYLSFIPLAILEIVLVSAMWPVGTLIISGYMLSSRKNVVKWFAVPFCCFVFFASVLIVVVTSPVFGEYLLAFTLVAGFYALPVLVCQIVIQIVSPLKPGLGKLSLLALSGFCAICAICFMNLTVWINFLVLTLWSLFLLPIIMRNEKKLKNQVYSFLSACGGGMLAVLAVHIVNWSLNEDLAANLWKLRYYTTFLWTFLRHRTCGCGTVALELVGVILGATVGLGIIRLAHKVKTAKNEKKSKIEKNDTAVSEAED